MSNPSGSSNYGCYPNGCGVRTLFIKPVAGKVSVPSSSFYLFE